MVGKCVDGDLLLSLLHEFCVNKVGRWLVGGSDCISQFGEALDDEAMDRFLSPLSLFLWRVSSQYSGCYESLAS